MRLVFWLTVALTTGAASGCVRHVAVADERELAAMGEPPPGSVDVNIIADDRRVWQVYAGDTFACATPCARRFSTTQDFTLESRRDSLYLPELGIEAVQARRAMVVVEDSNGGKKANGIVFTTLGGMGVVTGIPLIAVGCSNVAERGGLCTAGLITGGVSALLTAGAIWLIVDSLPKLRVLPVLLGAR